DQFVQSLEYNKGKGRDVNPEYKRIVQQKHKLRIHIKDMIDEKVDAYFILPIQRRLNELSRKQRSIPSKNPADPDYRRLWYCRYADDFLIGLIGPKEEAETIKDRIEQFLKNELNLELSVEKTGIKHAKTEGALFLGYEVQMRTTEKTRKMKMSGS